MSEENVAAINFIFYLQTTDELDRNYYILAEVFSSISINLLPILFDDLRGVNRNKQCHLISIRNDLSKAINFNQIRKVFLDTAMVSGKMTVFDISSFSEIENASKLRNKDMYRHFQLPQNLKEIAMAIALDYFRDRNSQVEWPGGRRAKLPSMTNES